MKTSLAHLNNPIDAYTKNEAFMINDKRFLELYHKYLSVAIR